MSIQNLSTICPDKLFEECSIADVQSIQLKLKVEVERKREELRTMVGERYRDLIEAADTISTMQNNAEKIISHIEKMSAKCLELQDKHLLGFKLDSASPSTERNIKRKPYVMMAVQLKLLMDIPERIWSAIDEEDYLLAAQLFLLARHINTCLQYSSGEEYIDSKKVLQWFPVLTRQWNAISLFRSSILIGCREKLKLIDLNIETASSCLATDLLLEGCSLAVSEQLFLNLRMESLHRILEYDGQTSIKDQICQSLKLLAQTLYFRHACFIEDSDETDYPGNLVSKKLLAIVGDDAPKSISLLKLHNESIDKFIPGIIQQFRPSWSSEPPYNSRGSTEHILGPWLNSVKEFLQKNLVGLLQLVTSIKGLYSIREGAWEVLNESKNKIPQSAVEVGVKGGGLWEVLFRPIVTSRVIDLISISLDRALSELKSALQEAALTANGSRSGSANHSEHNLYWYIWKEWPHDLQILESPPTDEKEYHSKTNGWMLTSTRSQKTPGGLEMKAKGYSPLVQKLCQNFDSHLEALLEDFLWYISDKDPSSSRVTSLYPFNKFIDKAELKHHLQTKTFECIKNLVEYVKNDMLIKFSECTDNGSNEASAVLVGRFLMGVSELCPQLQKCMCPSNIGDTKSVGFGGSFARTAPESNAWVETCRLLSELSIDSLRIWRRAAGQRIKIAVKMSLEVPISSVKLLSSIPAWDQVTIEEGSDEGQSIRSTIRVPCHPSFPLHSVLFTTCKEINRLTPHTLPRKIHQELIEDLVQSLLENYEPICKLENYPQIHALQFFFDVEYITVLLLGRENKALLELAHRICDKMKTFIDPFDYDVFSPYIHKNIKASVRRTQTLLGVALSPDKVMSLTRSAQLNESMPEPKDPSIMPLCSPNAPAFPFLPLSHSGNLPRRSPGTERVNLIPLSDKQVKKINKAPQGQSTSQQQKKGTADQSTSAGIIARSGAFFGAMGSDWF